LRLDYEIKRIDALMNLGQEFTNALEQSTYEQQRNFFGTLDPDRNPNPDERDAGTDLGTGDGGRLDSRAPTGQNDGPDNYRPINNYPNPMTVEEANSLNMNNTNEPLHYKERWEYEDLLYVDTNTQYTCGMRGYYDFEFTSDAGRAYCRVIKWL
jgi:hypothetical protein